MQRSGARLYGFEKDVNRLIDEYALQAELEQSFSFRTFKRLFKAGSYAYLHQAYPGCEHSTEYTQLLFATALDRLDVYSPTAPPESPLWLLHVDRDSSATAAARSQAHSGAPAAAAASDALEHCAVQRQHALAAAEAANVSGAFVQQCDVPQTVSVDSLAANNFFPPGGSHSTGVLPPFQRQQSYLDPLLLQQQQQQVQQGVPGFHNLQQHTVHSPVLPQQQQLDPPVLQQPLPQHLQQPERQQQQLQQQIVAKHIPQQHVMTLHSTQRQPQQQQQQQSQVAGVLQQCPLPQWQLQQEQNYQQGVGQPLSQQVHHLHGSLLQRQQHGVLQPQCQQQPDQMITVPTPPDQAAAALKQIEAEAEMNSDDFINDLLAMFEEAEGELQDDAGSAAPHGQLKIQQQQQPAVDNTTTGAAATAEQQEQEAAPRAAGQLPAVAPGQQHQQQGHVPSPHMYVPLAVKAAVVFTLHCLYDTQLSLPKVCIYTSLQHLKELKTAAADFSAAGPAATDVLAVLQVLRAHDRLLIGQFRRPVQWKAQLPSWLAPTPPKWPDLGMGSAAANRAAAKARGTAGGSAHVEAVVSAASIVRSLRNHKPNEVDPIVHRDAMFHIKTALRSLVNFKGLQALCSKYTSARRAIFEPLLKIRDPAAEQQLATAASKNRGQQGQQHAKGTKRAAESKQPASKRSRRHAAGSDDTAAVAAGNQQAEESASAARQQAAAAAVEAAAAIGVPELFDCNFGLGLSQLADHEAAHMLVMLDPAKNPHQVKRKMKQQTDAAKQAAAVTGSSAAELHELAGSSKQQHRRTGKPVTSQGVAGANGFEKSNYVKELFDAGIINPMELQDMEDEPLESHGSVPGFGAAVQVLKKRHQQRQHTLAMAEQWFRSHDAMIQLGELDDGDDMP